jgi:hypothetical protein
MESTDPRDPMLQREDDAFMMPILHPETRPRLAVRPRHHPDPGVR